MIGLEVAHRLNMKFFFLLGGFLGFSLSFSSGLHAGNDFGVILQNASICCVIGAFLMKGLRVVMLRSMHSAAMERIRVEQQVPSNNPKKIEN